MKNIWGISIVVFAAVIAGAIITATFMGEKATIYVSGEVVVAPHLREKAKQLRTIFLILRDAKANIPMPYGAYRTVAKFSDAGVFRFKLTKEKLQIMGMQSSIPSMFNIKVRLDVDGMGGADQVGDLVGKRDNVPFGEKAVKIKVDREIIQ